MVLMNLLLCVKENDVTVERFRTETVLSCGQNLIWVTFLDTSRPRWSGG
jgi:hypothetical protein